MHCILEQTWCFPRLTAQLAQWMCSSELSAIVIEIVIVIVIVLQALSMAGDSHGVRWSSALLGYERCIV
jgi:hypothetical protein